MSINTSFINQENSIENIKKAIEITSPREIINVLHDEHELNIDNEIINSKVLNNLLINSFSITQVYKKYQL